MTAESNDTPVVGAGGDGAFVARQAVADYLVADARMIAAPIRCGVKVTEVRRCDGRQGFDVPT